MIAGVILGILAAAGAVSESGPSAITIVSARILPDGDALEIVYDGDSDAGTVDPADFVLTGTAFQPDSYAWGSADTLLLGLAGLVHEEVTGITLDVAAGAVLAADSTPTEEVDDLAVTNDSEVTFMETFGTVLADIDPAYATMARTGSRVFSPSLTILRGLASPAQLAARTSSQAATCRDRSCSAHLARP